MRHELKYVVPHDQVAACLTSIWLHPYSFVQAFDDRFINNVYFDDPAYTSAFETHAGISVRKKFRVRWYGDWAEPRGASLEIKTKENQLGGKIKHSLPSFSTNFHHELEVLTQNLLLPPGAIVATTNRYLRSYYVSWCGHFRLTLDQHLHFGSPLYHKMVPFAASRYAIVELKYDKGLHLQAEEVRQNIPFQRGKFSKYVRGVDTFKN